MTRYLKVLVLMVLAAITSGAMAAQASAVVEHSFTSSANSTVLTGTNINENVFSLTSSPIEWGCESTTFSGTVSEAKVDQIAIHPEFAGCQWNGAEATTVTEGCNYVLDSDTTTSSEFPSQEHASVSVQCEAGKYIGVSISGCVLKISNGSGENQSLHGTRYEVSGSGSSADIKINWTVRTMHFTATGSWCALLGISTGTYNGGDFDGTTTLKGYEDNGGSEGAQVGLGLSTP